MFFATSKKDENINVIDENSSIEFSANYNPNQGEFDLEIQKNEDDKAERSPIYYIALNSDQDLHLIYRFDNSEESTFAR